MSTHYSKVILVTRGKHQPRQRPISDGNQFGDQVVSTATPEHIMQVGMGFWASKTLLSAVELGVFNTLADAPADLPTLQKKLALHQRSARDFLDALVALKLLERKNGVYSNTADTDLFLDRAKPSYIGGILEMANARLYGFWGSLTEAVHTGELQRQGWSRKHLCGIVCRSG